MGGLQHVVLEIPERDRPTQSARAARPEALTPREQLMRVRLMPRVETIVSWGAERDANRQLDDARFGPR